MKKRIVILALLLCVITSITSCQGVSELAALLSSEEVSGGESSVDESTSEKISSDVSDTSDVSDASDVSKETADAFGDTNREEFEGTMGESPIADLYEYCIDSCVSIVCTVVVESNSIWGQPTSYETTSLGSGFVIEGDYIVTNHHVIEGAKDIKVVFNGGIEVEAELVGSDATYDIAVLKVAVSKKLKPVKIGDSSAVRIGEEVIAIGTPSSIEYAGTLTYGVISGLNRKIDVTDDYGKVLRTMYLIQTDATLNPGNSGGPLFNMKGEVVGVNNMKLISTYEGIGFSIPINGAMDVINALIKGEEVPNGGYATTASYLGITGATVSKVKNEYNLPSNVPDGVFVVSVERKSSAYAAGLNIYDIITKFEGVEIKTIEELKSELSKYSSGTEVTIEVYRLSRNGSEGETHTLTFKLDKVS